MSKVWKIIERIDWPTVGLFALGFILCGIGVWALHRVLEDCRKDRPHMVTLVYLDDQWAGIVDTNKDPGKITWIATRDFLRLPVPNTVTLGGIIPPRQEPTGTAPRVPSEQP